MSITAAGGPVDLDGPSQALVKPTKTATGAVNTMATTAQQVPGAAPKGPSNGKGNGESPSGEITRVRAYQWRTGIGFNRCFIQVRTAGHYRLLTFISYHADRSPPCHPLRPPQADARGAQGKGTGTTAKLRPIPTLLPSPDVSCLYFTATKICFGQAPHSLVDLPGSRCPVALLLCDPADACQGHERHAGGHWRQVRGRRQVRRLPRHAGQGVQARRRKSLHWTSV